MLVKEWPWEHWANRGLAMTNPRGRRRGIPLLREKKFPNGGGPFGKRTEKEAR